MLTILLAASTSADEPIARRLAALKSLVDPAAAQSVRQASAQSPGSCPLATWWQLTGYGREQRISDAVRDASLRYAVDAALIRAVIRHESAGDFRAVSHKGAQGLMQLMPGTAEQLGVYCPFDPRENVLGGTRYLRLLHDRLGSWRRALAGYHAGPRRVESGRIPAVTRAYVERIMRTWRGGRVADWRGGRVTDSRRRGVPDSQSGRGAAGGPLSGH